MFTILIRIVRYGLQNFSRNGLLSVATVGVMVIALFMFISLQLFGHITTSALSAVKEKIDISVYFKVDAPEDEILRVKRSLEGLAEVRNVEYVSRDRALELFKETHKDDDTISQAVTELGENPLSASLNVKAHDPKQYASISDYLSGESLARFVDKVSFAQNQSVIERLALIVDTVQKSGVLAAIFLAVIAGLVVFNTIRLAIYSNREEIGIMRLVGASNSFVRGPYVFTGLVYGAIAALASIIFVFPAVWFSAPYLDKFIPGLEFRGYFTSNLLWFFVYQVAVGMGLGMISSFFAMRRYLKI